MVHYQDWVRIPGRTNGGMLYVPLQPERSWFYKDGLPVIFLLHGGFWKQKFDFSLMHNLALDLVARGLAVFNVEYRRWSPGNEGIWADTLVDVASAFAHVTSLNQRPIGRNIIDQSRIALVGHSAGGTLALWLPAIPKLRRAARWLPPSRLRPRVILAQAPLSDLTSAARARLSDDGDAVQRWLGGEPEEALEAYRLACPRGLVPLDTKMIFAHGRQDDVVPFEMSEVFTRSVTGLGGDATLLELACDHYETIDPASAAWATQREALFSCLA